jgi:hypothetical protein
MRDKLLRYGNECLAANYVGSEPDGIFTIQERQHWRRLLGLSQQDKLSHDHILNWLDDRLVETVRRLNPMQVAERHLPVEIPHWTEERHGAANIRIMVVSLIEALNEESVDWDKLPRAETAPVVKLVLSRMIPSVRTLVESLWNNPKMDPYKGKDVLYQFLVFLTDNEVLSTFFDSIKRNRFSRSTPTREPRDSSMAATDKDECYTCGKHGHFARDCPRKAKETSRTRGKFMAAGDEQVDDSPLDGDGEGEAQDAREGPSDGDEYDEDVNYDVAPPCVCRAQAQRHAPSRRGPFPSQLHDREPPRTSREHA